MDLLSLLDPASALIVVAGTFLATILRAGLDDFVVTARMVWRRGRKDFDPEPLRSELARLVQDVQSDGLLRLQPHQFDDLAFDDAAQRMLKARSIEAFERRLDYHKAQRLSATRKAVATLHNAAENAPTFGLAGTLIALSQLPSDNSAAGMNAALAAAVLTTLYGLLLSHLILHPVAEAVKRASDYEEQARTELQRWAHDHFEDAKASRPRLEAVVPLHASEKISAFTLATPTNPDRAPQEEDATA